MSSKRTPFKIVGEERGGVGAGSNNNDADGECADQETVATSTTPTTSLEDEEVVLSSDVISGDGDDWGNWSNCGGGSSAVEAIAVRREKNRLNVNTINLSTTEDNNDQTTMSNSKKQSEFLLYILRKSSLHQKSFLKLI